MAYAINININEIDEIAGSQAGLSTTGAKANTEQSKALKALGNYVSSQVIKPFVANVKNNITQNVQIVTGNTDLQQRINYQFEMLEFGVQLWSGASAGATIGSAFGPVGTGVGAVVGLALTGINRGLEIQNNKYQINLQSRMENYQLEQVRTRAGITVNRSRS